MALLILYIVLFIALSGFMALIEAAVLSISPGEVEELVQRKKPGAIALQAVRNRLTRALVVIVLLTNTVNVLGPILAGSKAISLYGDAVIGLVTAILTLGTIVFSEIIPKSLGTHYAPIIACTAAPFILALIYALYPVVVALAWITSLMKSGQRRIGTEEQIRSLVTIGRRAGYIERDEDQLIHRAFVLNDRTAADIMTPLKDVVSVSATASVREAAESVFRSVYSRYPVFGSTPDEVEGMVMSRDILEALSEGKDEQQISEILHPTLQVAGAMRCDNLMQLFRDRHIHLALVRDKDQTIGLVTLEDVLEELVGEIEDEHDPPT